MKPAASILSEQDTDDQTLCEPRSDAAALSRLLAIARTRWHLEKQAVVIAYRLESSGERVTAQSVRDELTIAVANARPRSRLISWHLPDEIVEVLIRRIAEDVAKEFLDG